jgi:hypothetical protein
MVEGKLKAVDCENLHGGEDDSRRIHTRELNGNEIWLR